MGQPILMKLCGRIDPIETIHHPKFILVKVISYVINHTAHAHINFLIGALLSNDIMIAQLIEVNTSTHKINSMYV
jgi:hypothetical protein